MTNLPSNDTARGSGRGGPRGWLSRLVGEPSQVPDPPVPARATPAMPHGRKPMNVRRITMDVDKAVHRPDLLELAEVIDAVAGVEALNITVGDIDLRPSGWTSPWRATRSTCPR